MFVINLSTSDVQLILDGLDELMTGNPPVGLRKQILNIRFRLVNHQSGLSKADIRIICEALGLLLDENPLDWQTNQLLVRFRDLQKGNPLNN